MKKIIPHKLIIEFDENEKFKNGLLLYRLKTNGETQKGFRSIAIKNIDFDKSQIEDILQKVNIHVKKIEGD